MTQLLHVLAMLRVAIGKAVQILRIAPAGNGVNVRIVFPARIEGGNLEEVQFFAVCGAHAMAMPEQTVMQMIALKQLLQLFEEISRFLLVN